MSLISLPEHPFWDFSIRLYTQPAVTTACLELQDRYGVNVNLLLYCCWKGWKGCILTKSSIVSRIQAIKTWQEDVVQPLRHLRTHLKPGISGFPYDQSEPLRQIIQQVEIEAEHIEQLRLSETDEDNAGPMPVNASVRVSVTANLHTYLNLEGIAVDDSVNALLQILVDASQQQT